MHAFNAQVARDQKERERVGNTGGPKGELDLCNPQRQTQDLIVSCQEGMEGGKERMGGRKKKGTEVLNLSPTFSQEARCYVSQEAGSELTTLQPQPPE